MKTLYQLALAAVPNPGSMAEKFLVPHHPAAKDLEERQYNEDRAKWQKEHKLKFRYVVFDLSVIKGLFRFARVALKRLLAYKKPLMPCTPSYFHHRRTMIELENIELRNWTWFLFPSHVVELLLEVKMDVFFI